jgi:hypothetical protein
MNHKAIYKLYPTVVTIDDGTGAFDKDGNKVEINLALVNAWIDPEAYKEKRAKEYPSIQDQLDTLYHEGYEGWKAKIETIKNKYPKGA